MLGALLQSFPFRPVMTGLLKHSPQQVMCRFKSSKTPEKKLKIAIIGQSVFATSVYRLLLQEGHQIVGVFTIPDARGRENHVAAAAASDGLKVFKIKQWRKKKIILPEVFDMYKSVGAELNVMPYCSVFIPMDVINHPPLKSICYHPSLLPKRRGAAAINWTLIFGDKKAGYSIFWADDGLDTGPILLQDEVKVEENDTVETIYNRFLFPEGVDGMAAAVAMIADGSAPAIKQSEEGASYEPLLNKPDSGKIKFGELNQEQLHNFIRGCDKVPGAFLNLDGEKVKVYGSSMWREELPPPIGEVSVEGMSRKGIVHSNGLILFGNDDKAVSVSKLGMSNGKMINASSYGQPSTKIDLGELSAEEKKMVKGVQEIWSSILGGILVKDSTDFFDSGASSMDVTRMIEAVRQRFEVNIGTSDVYGATTFEDFTYELILEKRGTKRKSALVVDYITIEANKMTLKIPHQLMINNQFVDSVDKDSKPLEVINPTDETLICKVQCATKNDVDRAVKAAHEAFENGEWSQLNARCRGKLMFKLADLMEANLHQLATIETLDSGAVYTLALKTHIGMSIETWRYFAGWCDKIEGKTIPINHARPNKNLTVTKREPIGVCGIITPWNYPLMMVSWKMAPCLAAGNTVVLKPVEVSPLTALKFAELAIKAGFPPGVINILPGKGSECGQAISSHPLIRKLGFTGSTPVGQKIMQSCASSNLKKVSLELGGKSPLIIFKDCDLDKAVKGAMGGVFFNKGENCIAAGRIFVEESLVKKFIRRVLTETKKLAIGDPLDRSVDHGPQNHRAHLEKLIKYCEQGVKDGATLAYGGKQVDREGLFFTPTIFTYVEDSMYIAKEESFGPIMIISSFRDDDLDGVVKRANATEYGLASGVFTKDLTKAMRVAERIHAGSCFINCYNKTDCAAPFGGFKRSGFGKDLGQDALNEYLLTKTITFEY